MGDEKDEFEIELMHSAMRDEYRKSLFKILDDNLEAVRKTAEKIANMDIDESSNTHPALVHKEVKPGGVSGAYTEVWRDYGNTGKWVVYRSEDGHAWEEKVTGEGLYIYLKRWGILFL